MKHAIAVAVMLTGLAIAQTNPKFVDNSPTGKPISLAADRSTTTGECKVNAHSTDARPVVAVVVDFDAGTKALQHMIHDHFLRNDEHIAMNGGDFEMTISCPEGSTVIMTTKFVQYNDGEVWEGSDAKTVSEIAANRRDAIDYLNKVLEATDIKAAIAKSPKTNRDANGMPLTLRTHEWNMLRDASDPSAVAKERLRNADAHASWLINLK